MDYGVSALAQMEAGLKAKPVRPKDWVDFRCQRCGACCRHLTDKVMVESLDAFRLVKFFREHGRPHMTMDEFYAQYAAPLPIARGYPIFMMNTAGPEEACVFLKDGACSVYPARPRTCRLYPFSVGPGQRGQDFVWYQCLDAEHHFCGGRVRVKDWAYQNFTREDREFVKREYDSCAKIGALLGKMNISTYEQALPMILLLRYSEFDVEQPFLPQYDHNLQLLLGYLHNMVSAGGE